MEQDELDYVAEAEAAIAYLNKQFPDRGLRELAEAQDAFAGFCDPANLDHQHSLSQFRTLIHNMKGQGGSFGYPLVTAVCSSFYPLIRPELRQNATQLALVKMHLEALRLIFQRRIAGDGGEIGAALVARLEGLARKA